MNQFVQQKNLFYTNRNDKSLNNDRINNNGKSIFYYLEL